MPSGDRERRRRAEVGEKFECLTKVLARAELALGEMQPASSSDEAGSRADVLQRTIDALAALTKAVEEKAPSADERSAVGGLLGVAAAVRNCSVAHALTQTDDENTESVVLIAQTTLPRPKLHELVRTGKALITVTPHLAAASAAASCTLPSNHDKLSALHPTDGLSASDLLFPTDPDPSVGGNNHHSRSHALPSYFAKAA